MCTPTFSCFSHAPHSLAHSWAFPPQPSSYGAQDYVYGGGWSQHIPYDAVHEHIVKGCNVEGDNTLVFDDHVDSIGQLAYPVD